MSLIYALSFANIPVSPRFFGEFEPDMLTFSARHFEKPLIPSSTQPTRKPPKAALIDHFHYDVTRAKVSGSCSKDRAQYRAIAGKCQKISRSAMSAKASYQVFHKVMCWIAIKFKEIQPGVFKFFFFDERRIAKSVVDKHFN